MHATHNDLGGFTQYQFYDRFFRFCTFFLLHKIRVVGSFSSAFLYVHIRINQTVTYTGQKFSEKIFL